MEKPDIGGQTPGPNISRHFLETPEIDFQFLRGQGTLSPLQQVVDPLGDLEKLRLRRADNHPLGDHAQGVHQGNQGLEDFGDAAAGGGAVGVDETQAAKLSGQGRQFRQQGRRQPVGIVGQGGLRVVNP